MATTQPLDHGDASRHRFAEDAAAAPVDAAVATGSARRALLRRLVHPSVHSLVHLSVHSSVRSCAIVVFGWLLALGIGASMDANVAVDGQPSHVALDLDDASASAIEPAPTHLELRGRALLDQAFEVTRTHAREAVSTSHVLIPIVHSRWTQGDAVAWVLRVPAAAAGELRGSPGGPWRVEIESRLPLRLAQALRRRGLAVEASTRLLALSPPLERSSSATAQRASNGSTIGALFAAIGLGALAVAVAVAIVRAPDRASATRSRSRGRVAH